MQRDPKLIVDNGNVHQHRKCEPFMPRARSKIGNKTPVTSTAARRKE